jgi:glycine hydroxymethyltransferase
VRRLESAGIYTGTCRLPWQAPGTPAEGLRLGVQEWVRSGAGFATIGPLAQLICAGLTEASHDTREAVLDLCGEASVDLWGRRMDEECPTELSGIR